MDAYERIIEQMRKSGKYYNAPVPQIGVVSSGKKIKLDNLVINKDDYLIDCNLRFSDSGRVYFHKEKPSGGEYLSTSEHNATMEEYKNNILNEGDRVLIMKLANSEQYIILAKVVSP